MRIKIFSGLFLCCIIITTGCATDKTTTSVSEEKVLEEKTAEIVKIEHFTDWQYKGFGAELPVSAEIVLQKFLEAEKMSGKLTDVTENSSQNFQFFDFDAGIFFEICENSYVFASKGVNPDQALSSVISVSQKVLAELNKNEDFSDLQNEVFWVLVNSEYLNWEKPYFAVRIYKGSL